MAPSVCGIRKDWQPSASSEAVLQSKELRFEIGQRAAKFGELALGTVDLQSRQVGDFERFRERGAHVFKVSEDTFAVLVSFAAMHFIAIKGKAVKKYFGLIPSELYEFFAEAFHLFELALMNLEVGDKRATTVGGFHTVPFVWVSLESFDFRRSLSMLVSKAAREAHSA